MSLIAINREKHRHFFQRAHLERESGLGARLWLYEGPEFPGGTEPHYDRFKVLTNISGTYLHFAMIDMRVGMQLPLEFRLIGPAEAVEIFMSGHVNPYLRPPIAISDIAVDIVNLATGNNLGY